MSDKIIKTNATTGQWNTKRIKVYYDNSLQSEHYTIIYKGVGRGARVFS